MIDGCLDCRTHVPNPSEPSSILSEQLSFCHDRSCLFAVEEDPLHLKVSRSAFVCQGVAFGGVFAVLCSIDVFLDEYASC